MTERTTLRKISYLQFGALTAQEIRAISVAEITTPVNRGSPTTDGTPYDLRLGVVDNGVDCETCGEKNMSRMAYCPGHFGHIELEEPVYNPVYLGIVLGIVKCVCVHCLAPRIPENTLNSAILALRKSSRFKAYRKKAENLKQCPKCHESLPKFFIDRNVIKMFYENLDGKKNAMPISAREMYTKLLQISGETMKLIGFNDGLSPNENFKDPDLEILSEKSHVHEVRPEAFIFTVLPVLPTCARPWVIRTGERKDDDITDKYNTILKINNRLRADASAPAGVTASAGRGRKKTGKLSEVDRKKAIDDLSTNVWGLIDNSKEKVKNNSRQQKGIADRLGGKTGHFQNNIGGKRVNFTARTVIVGGGSMLPMGWIGVPMHIAKTLTFPELVFDYTLAEHTRLLEEGKITNVIRQGHTINVSQVTSGGTKPFIWKGRPGLQKGDTVERQARNGDWGIFNRQPTLRIESMQGVQIIILPEDEYVFRVPVGMSRAFNFDYDGDKHLVPNRRLLFELIGRLEKENSVILSLPPRYEFNRLVAFTKQKRQHHKIAGKPLEPQTTTPRKKFLGGTRQKSATMVKTFEDWIIRSHAPRTREKVQRLNGGGFLVKQEA